VTVVVFTGPTLSPEDARVELDAVYLPPVSQGDVYRAAQSYPWAIGIVDGYFEGVPSVWHKEILWAMRQGVHVFGSASMGALRAAELEAFGMEGVGAVFVAYRDGILQDDDEVAVAHGPAEVGYRGQSEAMVNIRFTLTRAAEEGVISPSTKGALEGVAKDLFYPDRSYGRLLQQARDCVPEKELQAFQSWLPAGKVNQKREDAIAMLRVMRQRLTGGLGPKKVRFSFEHTVFWERATAVAGQIGGLDTGTIALDRLLDELRLEGSYRGVLDAAMARHLGVEEAKRQGIHVTPQMLRETADTFRRERGLLAPEEAERWMAENDLTNEGARLMMEGEALLRWARQWTADRTTAHLPDYLRSTGEYARLVRRALDKRRVLAAGGPENAGLEDVGVTEDELFTWYFERRLGRQVDPDIGRFAREAGFTDKDAFRRAVLREYRYSCSTNSSSTPSG